MFSGKMTTFSVLYFILANQYVYYLLFIGYMEEAEKSRLAGEAVRV